MMSRGRSSPFMPLMFWNSQQGNTGNFQFSHNIYFCTDACTSTLKFNLRQKFNIWELDIYTKNLMQKYSPNDT